MLNRTRKSIAHLQTSINKELSLFSAIYLTYSRRSCTSLKKQDSFSLKKSQKNCINVAIVQSKAVKNTPKTRKNLSSKNLKQILPISLQLKSAKASKGESKLKKKTVKMFKNDIQFESSSLGSTNLMESKASQCYRCCESVERNIFYEEKIRQQKQLIDKLQAIISQA